MSARKRVLPLLAFLLVFLSGCGGAGVSPFEATLAPTIALPAPLPTPLPGAAATVAPTEISVPTLIPSPTPTETPAATPTPQPAVLIGAGDIAYCGDAPEYQGDEHTAALVEKLLAQSPDAAVFTAGDTVYGDGTMAELKNCFDPSWGRFKERIHPAPGNHDYMTDAGAPYYAYFGAAAGEPGVGYYSYNLGSWHIVVLNSNCNDIACGPNSAQVQWLREDLQKNASLCTLAYWHHPRFSSGIAGGSGSVNPFWRTAVEMGVDVVVNGHDHDYERFAPMDAAGTGDPNGTREFVVGTGGAVLRDWGEVKPNSEARIKGNHGVIQLRLYPGSYEWQFFSADDPAQTDSGSGTCH